MSRVHSFLLLFATVLFLEAVGGSYIISAIQSIERQFQIPSTLSGFMVSASDIGYIPSVIFISYIGSKGNRAKWIAMGTFITALSYIVIASPNFIFPVKQPALNITTIQSRLAPSPNLLLSNVTIRELVDFSPIYYRIPEITRIKLLENLSNFTNNYNSNENLNEEIQNIVKRENRSQLYSLDGHILDQVIDEMNKVINGEGSALKVELLLKAYVHNRINNSENDIRNIKRSANAPFSFCGGLVNQLRQIIKEMQCDRALSNIGPFTVMFFALICLGIGRTMPWSLGVPMIDDNVKRTSMPAYFACVSFIRILGPITGFVIGSFCNKLYYNLNPPLGLTAKDPTWIGAWWIGFIIIGILLIGPSVLLYFFPTGRSKNSQVFPSNGIDKNTESSSLPASRGSELSFFDSNHVDSKKEEGTFQDKIKEFRHAYSEAIKSKVYLGAVAGRVLDFLAFRGYMVFLPKYLENHYGIPQYKAQRLMAMFGVFGFALGSISGGFITRRFKLNGRRAAIFVFVISLLNLAIFLSKILLGCHSVVNRIGADGVMTNFNYTNSCNAECGCESAPLFPVCNQGGKPFFSPCHAGCREVNIKNVEEYELEFSSCDCVPGEILKKEFCSDDCTSMTVIFFITVMAGAFIAGNGLVPGLLILLRSVPPEHRSISLGLQGFMVSLFATLPSPLLWGAIFDSACLVWTESCSDQSGACAIYDPTLLRNRVHIIYVAIRFVAALTDIYVIKHAKGLNIIDDESKDENKKNGQLPMQHMTS